jgi:hypothetical protein
MKTISVTDNKPADATGPASDENGPHDGKCGPEEGSSERKEEIDIPAHAPLYGGNSTDSDEEHPQDEKDASAE